MKVLLERQMKKAGYEIPPMPGVYGFLGKDEVNTPRLLWQFGEPLHTDGGPWQKQWDFCPGNCCTCHCLSNLHREASWARSAPSQRWWCELCHDLQTMKGLGTVLLPKLGGSCPPCCLKDWRKWKTTNLKVKKGKLKNITGRDTEEAKDIGQVWAWWPCKLGLGYHS